MELKISYPSPIPNIYCLLKFNGTSDSRSFYFHFRKHLELRNNRNIVIKFLFFRQVPVNKRLGFDLPQQFLSLSLIIILSSYYHIEASIFLSIYPIIARKKKFPNNNKKKKFPNNNKKKKKVSQQKISKNFVSQQKNSKNFVSQ